MITLIHRQESLSLLGFPIVRYIDIDDAESVLRAIRETPAERNIEIILHSPGGLVIAAQQIAGALADHDGRVTAVVPHYAMSGATLIALAADEIVLDEHAALGPVDPQLGEYPGASILKAVARKPVAETRSAYSSRGPDAARMSPATCSRTSWSYGLSLLNESIT